MELMQYMFTLIELIIFCYLLFNVCYFLLFAVFSIFKIRSSKSNVIIERKFAVLIPGYREDSVILETANAALQQSYSNINFDVIVIADSFSRATISELNKLPIIVFDIDLGSGRTKAKALNKVMRELDEKYDIALVLDADNIIEPDFLSKINQEFNKGFMIVQGHRVAKNLNNSMAVLDAISEEVNNKLYRKGHCVVGLPSGLIGSGMAFDYSLFKTVMKDVHAVGGFDKELELRLARLRYPIAYVENALIFDEKVHKSTEFKNQRRRWLSAQFVYLKRFFRPAFVELFTKGNIFFFNKLIQMSLLPRILLLGLISFLFIIQLFFVIISIHFNSGLGFVPWACLFIGVVLIFIFTIPLKFYNRKTLKALLSLPQTFFIMFLLLFKLKGANKKFIHTNHGDSN